MTSDATSELGSTSLSSETTEAISGTVEPVTTKYPTMTSTIPNDCMDKWPSKRCRRLANKIETLLEGKFKNNCKSNLEKWIEHLSEKEVCNGEEMQMEMSNNTISTSNPITTMEPCIDTWPKWKCRRTRMRLNKRFKKLMKKCIMTAQKLKDNLTMDPIQC